MSLRHGDRTPILLPLELPLRSARRTVDAAARAIAAGDLARAHELSHEAAIAAHAELNAWNEPGKVQDLAGTLPNAVAATYIQLLIDLQEAGWRVEVDAGSVYASPPSPGNVSSDATMLAAKGAVRAAMMGRVRESVRSPSTRRLLAEVEPRIRALMADPEALRRSLEAQGAEAVQPYLQLARRADGDDAFTGLPLFSIFRYLRYWWSFPYRETPGRSLPFLIRDAGQPGHPVCGLLNLASPVLRMAQRDDALGLTPRWLRHCATTLQAFAEGRDAIRTLESQLRSTASANRDEGRPAVLVETLWPQVATLLGAREISKAAVRLPNEERVRLAQGGANTLLDCLKTEVEQAIRGISFSGLGEDLEEALRSPADTSVRLAALGMQAATEWKDGRESGKHRRGGDMERLFKKKRSKQLSELLRAWAGLQPVMEVARRDPLRALVWGTDPAQGEPAAALGAAIETRKVRLLSTQVADVSVCGALPPYNALLGGKLAAMLALSREAAAAYHFVYDGAASDIQSQMAGTEVRRPAELLALTTTSFYSVGSAQYNRVSLPQDLGGARWLEVGMTAGHGTLHLSDALVARLSQLLVLSQGGRLISSTFGEGPSERLRKLRDGLHAVKLPADALLVHGFPRIVYLSHLGDLFPGAPVTDRHQHEHGATTDHIARWWRERWAGPRLPRAVTDLRGMCAPKLLSERFEAELASAKPAQEALFADNIDTLSDETSKGEDEFAWDTNSSEAYTSAAPATLI